MLNTTIIFNFLIIGTLISAILTITSINPVNSVVGLIAVYIHIAIYLIGLTFNFIGLSYLIIYVGAIAILFLFVVMMMNIKYIELSEVPHGGEYTKILPLGAIIGTLFLLELFSSSLIPLNNTINKDIYINILKDNGINIYDMGVLKGENLIKSLFIDNESIFISQTGREIWDSIFYSFSHIENLGHTLYTYGLLWFIFGSFILLLAMISPIVLCFDKNDFNNSPLYIIYYIKTDMLKLVDRFRLERNGEIHVSSSLSIRKNLNNLII
jgi:NADH-ubiquinone oxidoreductase chain 6